MSGNIPKYRKHPNGQAFVCHRSIQTKDHRLYLGKHGSEESLRAYRIFLERIEIGSIAPISVHPDPTVEQVVAAYDIHARDYYCKDGNTTSEYDGMRAALRPLLVLFGQTHAREFGPRRLTEVQQAMVRSNLSRGVVNKRTSQIKRFWRWASQQEIVPPDLYHRLVCVAGLRCGAFGVRETPAVRPVHPQFVTDLLPFVSPTVRAMIQVQYFCGCRPGEATIMRPCDLEMRGKIWLYRPSDHKNAWRKQELVKAVPTVAQKIIKPFLARPTDAFLFSPAEGYEWILDNWKVPQGNRKTKVYPSELRRRQADKERRRDSRVKLLKSHYTTSSYRRAVNYGIERAAREDIEIPHWHPSQLRHSISTYVSQEVGEQAAQRWLGHEHLATTGIYTEKQIKELIQIAEKLDDRLSA